ncbi:alanine--tRNA ligase [Chromatiales bacterium (ex Bugula neritina AB1)]|nr:alanine--tRNA ligase [Chromatiales bacterium (ex Bugula neritina AB1)]
MLSTSEIRQLFLSFFENKGHEIVKSSPLVPGNDATLLFTNAGMVQFKDVFLGTDKRSYSRATTSQRCVRAGGKHNDLENVGYTARHHTFFEMLGNFSFGDYFKEDAINYAWEFLTDTLNLPADKLWVTVFEEDDEAYELWARNIGVPEERIARIGAKDNFWQMGDTGPCGPCSEIFFDHGPEVFGGPPGTPDEDGDRYIEIWNLVFMQYDRSADGTLTPLPEPSVDTGMGLERIAAVLQSVHNNYEIDLFAEILKHVRKVTNTPDAESPSLNVIADHIRSCAFMIVDGVLPSNEGRGYVLRRIIRRAARHGHNLETTEPFFHKLVEPLATLMGEAFPELRKNQTLVADALLAEERRFAETLSQGMKILEADFAELQGDTVPGEVLFKLYDTYGFPLDLTADIARERNLRIDEKGFEVQMEAQRSRARAASQFAAGDTASVTSTARSQFSGYRQTEDNGVVVEIFRDGLSTDNIELASLQGSEDKSIAIVLDNTPFYGESGGQLGDSGYLRSAGMEFSVEDTQKSGTALVHYGKLLSGSVSVGDSLVASVDASRRLATESNHSATHLLHAGLRQSLGDHVHQKGSLVSAGHLRFDFSHGAPVSHSQLMEIESWVNVQVRVNSPVTTSEMNMDDAIAKGAMALFGEKYGDIVRVVEIGDHSTELCGGTHVDRAGDIGLLRILGETGVAAGVRRIEAVTGAAAIQYTAQEHHVLRGIAATLKAPVEKVDQRVSQLTEQNRALAKEVDRLNSKLAAHAGDSMLDHVIEIEGVKVLAVEMDGADAKTLRESIDKLKDKMGRAAIVLAARDGEKVKLIAGVAKELTSTIKAGDLVNHVALQVGGKGGGRPDLAQAGGTRAEGLEAALQSVSGWVSEQMKAS